MMKMTIQSRLARYGVAVFLAIILVYGGTACPSVLAAPEVVNPAEAPGKNVPPAKVVPPTLTVTLQDEDGLPVKGVTLHAMAADSTGRETGKATTDETGKAVFKNLRSGSYYFFANINALRQHAGYGMPLVYRAFKTTRSFFLSESRSFDLSADAETTYVIKRNEHIWFETYLQVVRSGKIVIMNPKLGMQHIIPVASTDFIQIYLPMRNLYKIVTIKDDDYDSWVMEIYAHEQLRIQLL